MSIEIDKVSGFCFGVVGAIRRAEEELATGGSLCCLGDLVHNSLEMERLEKLGLRTIDHDGLESLAKGSRVLLRAHGEPPATYRLAERLGLSLADATCPVVLRLQKRIHSCYLENRDKEAQIVIYGKQGHAEVNGLVGQTEGTAIVVEGEADLEKLDFGRPIHLFSQTTMPPDGLQSLTEAIRRRMLHPSDLVATDTTCRQVANRMPHLKAFAMAHDYIYFVAGEKSSNGAMLFEKCSRANPRSLFVNGPLQINKPLPETVDGHPVSVGVCGATSTPKWLMEAVAERIRNINGASKEIG